MKKKSKLPITKTKKPEPKKTDADWVIWAAWADRVTFEEIKEQTGLTEPEVIQTMRRELKPNSFRRWRKRVYNKSIKHRKKFIQKRKQLTPKYPLRNIDESQTGEQ